MSTFKLNIRSIKNYGSYEAHAKAAAELFIQVFNSPEFKQQVTEFVWNGEQIFADNDGLTNTQVYEKLLGGAELPFPAEDNEADINLTAYGKLFPLGSAIGYTDANSSTIFTKWRFVKNSEPFELAGHYAHEYCHCIGFGHDYEETDQRPFSVPYAIGDIVCDIAAKISK